MGNDDLNQLTKMARRAIKKHDFEEAFQIAKKLELEGDPVGIYTCGMAYENGWGVGDPDFEKALHYFRRLAVEFDECEGYLGCVRIALVMKNCIEYERAVSYCTYCLDSPSSVFAYLDLGRVYEELHDPPMYKCARKAYLKSFLRGSPIALRKYSSSLILSKKYVFGVLMHVVTTILSPLMILIGGRRFTRYG